MLNILRSVDYFDYQCLDKIYAGLIQENPYNQAIDTPWIAQDWTTSSWIDPDDGQSKTVVTYYFRKDAYWVKPVTGAQDGLFTAKDYEFTCYYIYAQSPFIPELSWGCPHVDKFKHIHHVQVINDYCVKVYMDISSVYAYKLPIYPLLPKHMWLKEPLAHNNSATFDISQIYNNDGTIPLNEYVVSGSQDTKIKAHLTNGQEAWLTYGDDFMWKKGDLVLLTYSINGVNIDRLTVYYWTTGSITGYFPGGQNWQYILEGCGTHYVVNLNEEVIALNANRCFFLETPILGEIDWRYNFIPGAMPRSGYFKIDVLDVIKANAAYGSRGICGDGQGPSNNWFPGADLASTNVGKIDVLDLVQVTNNYAKTFGTPP